MQNNYINTINNLRLEALNTTAPCLAAAPKDAYDAWINEVLLTPKFVGQVRSQWSDYHKREEVLSEALLYYLRIFPRHYRFDMPESHKFRLAYTSCKLAARSLGEGYWTRKDGKGQKKEKKGVLNKLPVEIISLDELVSHPAVVDMSKELGSACFDDHEYADSKLEVMTAVPASAAERIELREKIIGLVMSVHEVFADAATRARVIDGLNLVLHGDSHKVAAAKIGMDPPRFSEMMAAIEAHMVGKKPEWKPEGNVVRRNGYQPKNRANGRKPRKSRSRSALIQPEMGLVAA